MTRASLPVVLLLALSPPGIRAATFDRPPAGYTLVAEDDCGNPDLTFHVTRGKDYVFAAESVSGSSSDRDIIFDDDFCLLRYPKLNPKALYKVDIVYVAEASAREQSLEANGLPVHGRMPIPATKPGRFIFDIPRAACSDGKPLELKFIKQAGANAVVSYVRIWSTDPTPLPGKSLLWTPTGPVEKDWLRQDRLRGKPRFSGWENPLAEVHDDVLPCVNEQLDRGRAILGDLENLGARDLDSSRDEFAKITQARDALRAANSTDPQAWFEVYRSARWAVRRVDFKNPLLSADGLLFVRRHHAVAMHQCARRQGTFTEPGGDICLLTQMRADGEPTVVPLSDGRFPAGAFGRPDLSFDGKRIAFGFAPQRSVGTADMDYGGITEQTAPLYAAHKVGPCEAMQVWEMALDGKSPPRQLTSGPYENSDPLYLPDGRIAFTSDRAGGLVQCGDWALSYCVFSMTRDGGDVRQITVSKDGEWDPFLLGDGTIGFTRWEYVMKFWSPIQMLWSVRPDGTNPRMIYGSDLSRDYAYPLNYASARQIPGTSKLACIGAAHHNTGAGPLCVVDMAVGPSEASGLKRVTPIRFVETPDQQPDAGWYDCPYPLSDKYFLVSYSPALSETDADAYGIYLLDTYGGKELIYRTANLSAMFPVPLRARPVPSLLPRPDIASDVPGDSGEFVIQDVHAGLPESMRGLARYVQVVECHERKIHTSPYAVEVGPDSGFETKTVLGTVPVASDGSAFFRVPAGKSVFFSVLDANHQALHTMRSVTNLQAGERTGCVGCHEGYRRAPSVRSTLAAQHAPARLEAPPWGVRPMEFAAVVQPVLDRACVHCHDGSGAEGKAFDLTARENRPFMGVPLPVSYYNLRAHVKHAPIFTYFLPPGSFGSRVSPVTQMLAKGHHDVKLDPADWHRLCAWIDCNAPGIGDYAVADVSTRVQRMATAAADQRKALFGSHKPTPERPRQIAAGLSAGQRLACYLDCGPAAAAGQPGDVTIRETNGMPFSFGAGPTVAEPWFDDITFDGDEVAYEVTGLAKGRHYALGFSWWDYDGAKREEAGVVTSPGGRPVTVLGRTKLPSWAGGHEKAMQQTVAVPPALTQAGAMRVAFTNAAGIANTVVSEVWLIEQQ